MCRLHWEELPEVPGDDRGYCPTVRTSSASPRAVTPVLLPCPPDNQHIPAEANSLHSSGQAATVPPGLAGTSWWTKHIALSGAIRLSRKQPEETRALARTWEEGARLLGPKVLWFFFKHATESF